MEKRCRQQIHILKKFHATNLTVLVFVFVFVQEGFCEFSRRATVASQDSSMKKALFAAAGVGLAGLTFLLVRQQAFCIRNTSSSMFSFHSAQLSRHLNCNINAAKTGLICSEFRVVISSHQLNVCTYSNHKCITDILSLAP